MMVLPLVALLVQALDGVPVDALQAPAGTKAIVFIFTTTDCPVSNRYAPEIQRLQQRFAPKGVVFRLVYPGRSDREADIREHMKRYALEGLEAVRDPNLALVKFTGATITPEAAIVVKEKLVYHGRIDDRYVELGVERPSPTVHDLADALAAVLAGKPVAHATAPAVGCFIADMTR
jgi:thiol-disulfide isomerase/thioredoxin